MGKNTQVLSLRTQLILGKQSIMEYSGLRLNVDEVRSDDYTKYGVRYYTERIRIVSGVEKFQRKFLNYFRHDLRVRGWNYEVVDILYFRGCDTLHSKSEKLKFLIDSLDNLRNLE